ncbi:MAG: rhomboid family intramembrane serine protease [bacterium]
MFPLRDENPSYQFPIVVVALILVNVAFFLWEISAPEADAIFHHYALIPAAVTGHAAIAGNIGWSAIFSSMFMHAGWGHLIGNMWFLWLFGDNIEWVMGRVRFILFYFMCGIAAALAQVYLNPTSTLPMVGASGAIAGVIAVYVISYPSAKIQTLIAFFYYWRVVPVSAVVWIGIWILMQVLGSVVVAGMGDVGGVAYAAHIGGFAAGLLFGIPLRRRERIIHAGADGAAHAAKYRPQGYSLQNEIERQKHEKGIAMPSYGVPALDDLIRRRKYGEARATAAAMLDEALRSGNQRMITIFQSYLDLIHRLQGI